MIGTLALLGGLAVPAGLSESPRTTTVELRFSGYRPAIDSQFDAAPGPYETVFGKDSSTMFLLGLHQHFFNGFGTASGGMAVGYWSADGKGVSSGDATDTTTLRILPVLAEAQYRLDVWQDFVPIVPSIRLGIDYFAWDILDGSDETSEFKQYADKVDGNGNPVLDSDGNVIREAVSTSEASGGTWGFHYALGLHILLDFLAPEMATNFDRDAGVNNSYLTLEYQSSQVDDFGSSSSFRLGDDTFYIGLALDL